MVGVRSFVIASLAMVSGIAAAQFDGPAPLAWRWQQGSPVSPNGSPVVDGNTIYFNLGNRVYAIDQATGNTKWKYPNGAPSPGIFRRAPILVNGVLCSYNDKKEIYGLDPNTGELRWLYQAPYAISGQIVAVGKNIAFAMDGGNLMGVDSGTGNAIYDAPYRILDGIRGPIYSDGRSVVSFFDGRNNLQAIDLASKKVAWRQPFGVAPPDGSMTVSEGYLYVYTGTYMACLNASSGSLRWQKPMSERMIFAPAVGNGMVLAISQQGNAYFYDDGGNIITRKPIELGSQPSVMPTCVGKKFVVPTINGSVQLVSSAGTVDWQYYVRPMNDAARNAGTESGATGKGAGPGGFGQGGPGGFGQGSKASSSTNNDPIVVEQITAPVALCGHTLLVPAEDASLLAFDMNSGVDLIGPEVKQVWPSQGELVSGKSGQEFIFKIEDEASGVNISSVKMDIDGKAYNFDFGRDGYLICQISQFKKNPMIANGRHVVHITASDWMGNQTNLSVTIRVDNALDPLKRPGTEDSTTNGGRPGGKGGKGGFGGGGTGAGAG
ncbi:MAG: PQQ-binding-like beta-propeller repeat protein [Armatimonadetes bacterium]|nr:PQQ-binding-like beta-propeller repeat protein [Armatimonadota bacterium]